jgi:ribonuclease P protein component
MLKKEYRLKAGNRIKMVRTAGQSWRNRWLVLCTLSGEQEQNRFAFSVSKRVGNAVTRNRIKRYMREAVRQQLPQLHGGWDILLIARERAARASYQEIEDAILDLLRQSHLWNPAVAQVCDGLVDEIKTAR